MKNKLLIGLFAFLISLSLVVATSTPMPVHGQVQLDGYKTLEGLNINQKNLRTNMDITFDLDANGYYLVEWANYPWLPGDQIEISVEICDHREVCRKTIELTGEPLVSGVNFFVPSTYELVEETIVKYICHDGVQVDDLNECTIPNKELTTVKEIIQEVIDGKTITTEVIKEVTVEKYVCEDGETAATKEECETHSGSWLVKILGILLALFASAGGWKFYRGTLTHYHRGLRGYHNAHTRHQKLKYRHARFWSSPLQCVKDVKKIQEGIDLSQE